MQKTVDFPFFAILGLVFITLKLTGFITWSWWLVLLPIYGGLALVFGLGAVLLVGVLFVIAVGNLYAFIFKTKKKNFK